MAMNNYQSEDYGSQSGINDTYSQGPKATKGVMKDHVGILLMIVPCILFIGVSINAGSCLHHQPVDFLGCAVSSSHSINALQRVP